LSIQTALLQRSLGRAAAIMFVPNDFADRKVCIFGLGYVGLTLACTMANVGFRVWGVEVRRDVVDRLQRGQSHFYEPGLEDLLQRVVQSGALKVHETLPKDCSASVFIITVGTPLDSDRRARLDMVANVSREVASAMPAGALVVLRSTVRLGTSRKVVAPLLDAAGLDYDLAFCPERTMEGVALLELRSLPQIVGGATLRATVRASQVFQFMTPTTVRVHDLETAEMIKLVDNTQRDVHFAFSNEVARMCDAIGVNAVEVIAAGKLSYPRTNLPIPGPVGGPCLEKDSYILAEGLEPYGLEPEITLAARRINERLPQESIAAIKRVTQGLSGFPDRPVIALLGLAFKGRPPVDDLRGTTAKPILQELRRHYPQSIIRGFDAVVSPDAIRALELESMSSIESAMCDAHLVVIANNYPAFTGMPLETISATMAKPALIYDFWNSFDARNLRLAPGVCYMALGNHGAGKTAHGVMK
jgi:UDP-N-acetyl-D-mannosaminuronic acid dehydrogenase